MSYRIRKKYLKTLTSIRAKKNNNNKPFESKVYFTKTYNNIDMQRLIDILANQAYKYLLTKINNFRKQNNNQIEGSCFTRQE
jgi:hypothetical protein